MPDTPPSSPLPCDCCGADMQARLDELIHVSGTLNDRECNHIHLCPQCAAGLSLPRIAVAPGRCEPIPSLADVSAKRARNYRALGIANSLSLSKIAEIAEQEGLPRIGYAELAADMHASVDIASERDQGYGAAGATENHSMLNNFFHDMLVGQQAAWIEWQHGAGAEAGMKWIHNGLAGPGLIPPEDAAWAKEPQAFFDANRASPFPACYCGRPSNILWMGQGFCCREHYDAYRNSLTAEADTANDAAGYGWHDIPELQMGGLHDPAKAAGGEAP